MSTPNVELYQFEKHLEVAFKSLLQGTCANVYRSREPLDLESSRIELKAIVGENLEHRHPFADGSFAFDVWQGKLEMTVCTNRSTDKDVDNHSQLIGAVRSRITLRYVRSNFTSDVLAIDDIRDSGTVDTFTDENDIDITTLSFYLVFNVKPSAWSDF